MSAGMRIIRRRTSHASPPHSSNEPQASPPAALPSAFNTKLPHRTLLFVRCLAFLTLTLALTLTGDGGGDDHDR